MFRYSYVETFLNDSGKDIIINTYIDSCTSQNHHGALYITLSERSVDNFKSTSDEQEILVLEFMLATRDVEMETGVAIFITFH